MSLYQKVLNNEEFLTVVQKIESIRFITDGKWDWEHGLGHFKRVAEYVKEILLQLSADSRTIDLGMTAALLHDIGLSKGDKVDHALESSKLFYRFLPSHEITFEEQEILRQAIMDHSKAEYIQSLVGLALVLADKLDVTYHRTQHSSIQDTVNQEIQKIKKVSIKILEDSLIVSYEVDENFNLEILKAWPKAITIPYKVAHSLNKEFRFFLNGCETNISSFLI